jgi:predicted naringenin-chalcone synthase
MGCYAAIPGLAVASDYVIAQRRPTVLVCTKLPSLRVQSPWHDPASRCVRTSPTMGLSSDSSASFMSSIAY